MRHTTHVLDLRKHLATHGMNRVGGEAPSSDLLGGEDAGIEEVALTFTGYRRALADDQACGGALRVYKATRSSAASSGARERVKGAITIRFLSVVSPMRNSSKSVDIGVSIFDRVGGRSAE